MGLTGRRPGRYGRYVGPWRSCFLSVGGVSWPVGRYELLAGRLRCGCSAGAGLNPGQPLIFGLLGGFQPCVEVGLLVLAAAADADRSGRPAVADPRVQRGLV